MEIKKTIQFRQLKKRVSFYGKTKEECYEKYYQMKIDAERGINVFSEMYRKKGNESITVKNLSNMWLGRKEKNGKARKTISAYSDVLKCLKPIEEKRIEEVATEDLAEILSRYNDHLCQKNRIYSIMRELYYFAVEEGLYTGKIPVTSSIKPEKYKAKNSRSLSEEEIEVFESIEDFTADEKLFIKLAKDYGLRKEEALALEIDDLDLKNEIIKINKALDHTTNQAIVKETKNKIHRDLPILQFDTKYFTNVKRTKERLLFDHKGKHYSQTKYRNMWRSIRNKLKIEAIKKGVDISNDITSRTLRHTYATQLRVDGYDAKEIQYLLGHERVNVSQEVYIEKPSADSIRKKMERKKDS